MNHNAHCERWKSRAHPLAQADADSVGIQFLYPVADRLLHHCDAVLRISGASVGAGGDVTLAGELGLPVYPA